MTQLKTLHITQSDVHMPFDDKGVKNFSSTSVNEAYTKREAFHFKTYQGNPSTFAQTTEPRVN